MLNFHISFLKGKQIYNKDILMLEYIKTGAIVGAMVVVVNCLSERFFKKTWL